MLVYFDTNMLLYRFDHSAPRKQAIARRLLDDAIGDGSAVLSTQNLQEFYSVATAKFKMPGDIAQSFARSFARATVIQLTPDMIFAAMDRQRSGSFAFWDALVIEAALRAGVEVLYSEDMQHGQVIEGLRLHNPFEEAPG